MLIARKPLKNGSDGKKGHKQFSVKFIYQSHGWLIFYHSFIYGFIDDENEETLK